MTIDWNDLAKRTEGFASHTVQKSPNGSVDDVTVVGLQVRLSDIITALEGATRATVTICADTLIVDASTISAAGVVVVARVVDTAGLSGEPLAVVTSAGAVSAIQIIAGETSSGPLVVSVGGGAHQVPTDIDDLTSWLVAVDETGAAHVDTGSSVAHVADVVGRIFALNSYRAIFAAAARLMASDSSEARATARSMMNWVTAGTSIVGQSTMAARATWTELHDQALPLAIELNVASGATYVPVLSKSFYATQVTTLLDALDSYGTKVSTLEAATDISAAVTSIGDALGDVATTELGPLDNEIAALKANITGLTTGVNSLDLQFQLQSSSLDAVWANVEIAITDAQIKAWFNACFNLSMKAIKLTGSAYSLASSYKKPAAPEEPEPDWDDNPLYEEELDWADNPLFDDGDAPGGDGDDGGDGDGGGGDGDGDGGAPAKAKPGSRIGPAKGTVTGAIDLLKGAADAIRAVTSDPGAAARPLLKTAQQLVEMQQALLHNFVVSTGEAGAFGLANDVRPMALDPHLAWDNYMADAKMAIEHLNMGAGDAYLAQLEILSNYGKSLAAKVVAITDQRAKLHGVQENRAATAASASQWRILEAQATTDEERRAALLGVLNTRTDSIRRSLFGAWQKYRDSYYYLYFAAPPVTIDLDTDAAALRAALAQTSQWVAKIDADDASGSPIKLPNDNVKIPLTFAIESSDATGTNTAIALRSPAKGKLPATLTWVVPLGTDQLVGVLPDRGDVAIWITEAVFTIDGATPNDKGNIIAQVVTSGTYENGFGPTDAHTFVSRPMMSNYAYRPGDATPYIGWKTDTTVVMTPTPFTQWTMAFADSASLANATQLNVELTVSYRRKP